MRILTFFGLILLASCSNSQEVKTTTDEVVVQTETQTEAQSQPQEASGHQVVDAKTFHDAISEGDVVLIDARTPREYSGGHIEGSENIDFLAGDFMSHVQDLDKNETVYIYCASGRRSASAAQQMINAGFKHVVDLSGGFSRWPY